MQQQQTKAVLLRAADIISAPNAWTQLDFARGSDAEGSILLPSSTKAVCWCAAGAIYKAHFEATDLDLSDEGERVPALEALAAHLGWKPNAKLDPVAYIAKLNDNIQTTAEMMVAKIKEAAEKL
jgi:hypothetical protein